MIGRRRWRHTVRRSPAAPAPRATCLAPDGLRAVRPRCLAPGRGLLLRRHHLPPGGRSGDGHGWLSTDPKCEMPSGRRRWTNSMSPSIMPVNGATWGPSCSPGTARLPRTVVGPSRRAGTSAFEVRAGYMYAEGEGAADIDPARLGRAPHPRGPAPDPVHAQGGHRGGARVGRSGVVIASTWFAT